MSGDLQQPIDREGDVLRGTDWRFLLADGPESVTVLSNPSRRVLRRARAAIAPGGTCYIEWNRVGLGSRRRDARLRQAGLEPVENYWAWPPPARRAPLFWLPLGSDNALAHFLATRPTARTPTRRALRRASRGVWRVIRRSGFLAPTATIAWRTSDTDHTITIQDELKRRWAGWGLGPVPDVLSCIMLTGGQSRLNKVVLLVFVDNDATPRLAVKLARVPEAETALVREARALEQVADGSLAAVADVPRVVFSEQLAGTFAVGETAVMGTAVTSTLSHQTHRALALQVTEVLAAMVSGGELIVPSAYWDRIVEPVLADFETRFGRVVDHDALHESRQALRSLPSLPITPEHRDCSPWNVLVTTNGRLGFLDWESAEPAGLPVLDAVYYLSNATFFIDGTLRSGRERETYAKMLQPTTKTGRVFTEAMDLYCKKTGIDPSVVPILRRFTWMVHAAGEHDRIMSVQRELSADDAARRSTFLSLWLEEVRHARSDPRFLVPDAISAVRPRTAPTFSIVIPAYQAADVVADAVESALAQTVQPTEIIVCNDGSTDDIVAALAPYRGRITVINRENGGEAAAKNTGVRAATGEFVAILDADDIFLPRRLEALSELAAARPDLDLLTTDAFMVVNGRVARRCFTDTFPFPTDDQRKAILRNNFLPFAAVRRSAYLAVGGFDETLRRVPDWDCWLRMILEGAHAGFVNEPLAEYRLRATNITSDRVRVHQGLLETLDKARQRSDLSDEERRLVESGIAAHKRELEIRAARQAILDGTVDARRRCAGVVFGRGMSASARAKAAVAALLPRTARRFLTSRDRDVTEVAGRIRVHLD